MNNPYAWHPEFKAAVRLDDAGVERAIRDHFNPAAMRLFLWFLNEYTKLAFQGPAYPYIRVNTLFDIIRKRLAETRAYWSEDERIDNSELEDDRVRMLESNVDTMDSMIERFNRAHTRADKVIAIDAFAHAQHFGGHIASIAFGVDDEYGSSAEYYATAVLNHLRDKRNPSGGRLGGHYHPLVLRALGWTEKQADKWACPGPLRKFLATLSEYAELASKGKALSDQRVNALHLELLQRLNVVAPEYFGGENDIEMVSVALKGLKDAYTRVDKVLAIDQAMHIMHERGYLLPMLYGLDPEGDEEWVAKKVLDHLFVQRNNPFRKTRDDTAEHQFLFHLYGYPGAQLVGSIDGDTLFIDNILLSPEMTGQGIGRKLIDSLELWAKKQGIKRLTGESVPMAEGFWKKMGFKLGREIGECVFISKVLR